MRGEKWSPRARVIKCASAEIGFSSAFLRAKVIKRRFPVVGFAAAAVASSSAFEKSWRFFFARGGRVLLFGGARRGARRAIKRGGLRGRRYDEFIKLFFGRTLAVGYMAGVGFDRYLEGCNLLRSWCIMSWIEGEDKFLGSA